MQRRSKTDGVAVVGVDEDLTQGPWAAVAGIRHERGAGRGPFEPKRLVRSCRVAKSQARAPHAPGAAATRASIRILPGRRGTGLHRPVGPPPIAILIDAQVGLDRDPIPSGTEHGRGVQAYLKDAGIIDVRLTSRAVDGGTGQTAAKIGRASCRERV